MTLRFRMSADGMINALEGFTVGKHDANCPKPIDEYEDAADAIERGEWKVS